MTCRMIGITAATTYLENKRITRLQRQTKREGLFDFVGGLFAFLAIFVGPVLFFSLFFYASR